MPVVVRSAIRLVSLMKSLSFPVTGKQIDGVGMVVVTEYKSFSMQHRDKYDE